MNLKFRIILTFGKGIKRMVSGYFSCVCSSLLLKRYKEYTANC